jgi:type I restriction enzyme S subunit
VETNSHGTAQANVSAEGILSIRIVVPPKTLRDKFNQIGQQFLDRILAIHHESYTLSALRDVLLPKLISGELCVGGLKKAVPGDGHREVACDSRSSRES